MSDDNESRKFFTTGRSIATIIMLGACLAIPGVDLIVKLGLFVGWVVFEYMVLQIFD